MSDPIGAIGLRGIQGIGDKPRSVTIDIGKGDGPSFSDTLKRALGEVSAQQDVSQDYIQRFVRGEPVELHQVMAAAEEAQLSLEMLVELRNKLMDAYKTVMTMG